MKFLEKYRKDILEVFEDNAFSKVDFQFVKSKGRIITEHKISDKKFSFFIRKSVVLNGDSGKFEYVHHFEAQQDQGSVSHCPEWSDVMTLYRGWLLTL